MKPIFKASLDASVTLLMVEYADGQLAILRNGRPVNEGPWPSAQLDDCIDVFQRMCRAGAPRAV